MPLKPHPTDPDKMVYVSRKYDTDWLNRDKYTKEEREKICVELLSEAQSWDIATYLKAKPTCQHCEYHKDRAARWRAEAYKLVGHEIELPWVGLTDEEVESYDDWADFQVGCGRQTLFDMIRDIEAKLKEKNT